MLHVVIVGAGISGLTVAHRLLRDAGDRISVSVLEAAERPGGTIRSAEIDGYLCEHGPQGLLDNAPDTLTLVRELGLEIVESAPSARRRYLFRGGRLRELPGSPGAAISSDVISWRAKLRALAEPFVGAGTGDDETIYSFATRRFGREIADSLVDPMVSGIYAGNAARLSIRAAFPVIWDLEQHHGSLVRGMIARRRTRRTDTGSPRLGHLFSFANGIQALPDALARGLTDHIKTREDVIRLQSAAPGGAKTGRWRVRTAAGLEIEADHVVIAGPPAMAPPLTASFDRELGALLAGVPSAPVAVVALGYPRTAIDHSLAGFGFLVPRKEGLRTLGVLWESSIFPDRAPGGHVLLRLMIGGAHDPAAVTLDDRELLAIATGDLRRTLGVSTPPAFTYVVRHPIGIPQCTLGHAARLAQLDAALTRWPGLHLTGWGYRGVSINSDISEATALARSLVAGDAPFPTSVHNSRP